MPRTYETLPELRIILEVFPMMQHRGAQVGHRQVLLFILPLASFGQGLDVGCHRLMKAVHAWASLVPTHDDNWAFADLDFADPFPLPTT